MTTIMKLLSKKWFTWHRYTQPKDVPIQSVYEILSFLVIFIICLFLYIKCNEVPFLEEDIQVECLDNKTIGDKNGDEYIKPSAHIIFTMPYSNVNEVRKQVPYLSETETIIRNLAINFGYTNIWKDSLGHFDVNKETRNDFITLNRIADSLVAAGRESLIGEHYKYFSDYELPANINYRKLFPLSHNSELEDYYKTFEWYSQTHHIEYNMSKPVFFYKASQTIRKKLKNTITKRLPGANSEKWIVYNDSKTSFLGTNIPYVNIFQLETGEKQMSQTGFISGVLAPGMCFQDPHELALGDPGWFTLEDISQAYYKFNLKSETIDSLYLRIDFVGASTFSTIDPTPDAMTMSSIAFENPEKIKRIKERGLYFHVKFSELENRQNVRMFFLTAIMSALFTIFIGFLVLALYKIAVRKKIETNQKEIKYGQNETGRPDLSET